MAWLVEVRYDVARFVPLRIGMAGQGRDRSFAMAWQASPSSGMVWSGQDRIGEVGQGKVWQAAVVEWYTHLTHH